MSWREERGIVCQKMCECRAVCVRVRVYVCVCVMGEEYWMKKEHNASVTTIEPMREGQHKEESDSKREGY